MKLFVKIFLWFLAAIALVVGVLMFVTRTFQTEPMVSRQQRSTRNQMTVYSGTATQIVNGEGEAGLRGGPPGDLYIFLSVKPHAFFQRDGADLYCRVPISMVRAAIGGEISVHAIDSSECKLKVPEGTQSGRQLKVKGKGMPVLRGRDQGDLHVQISVETPQNLTKRQRELLHEFEQESSHHTHPESTGFFARMKELFGK